MKIQAANRYCDALPFEADNKFVTGNYDHDRSFTHLGNLKHIGW